jgi:hypothetical protein
VLISSSASPLHLPVGDRVGEGDVLEVADALQRHQDPLQAVGDLHRRRLVRVLSLVLSLSMLRPAMARSRMSVRFDTSPGSLGKPKPQPLERFRPAQPR